METCSSGEDLIVKARKPYTITKQRERWTDDEHGRFLEAIKLYGRAWQKIEEHIGTKTAIQIRSHAQKFFTKLEKAVLIKGLPLGQAHDIDIPPPRPKKKPSNPYPRKTCMAPIVSSGESISSHFQNKDVAHPEKDGTCKTSAGTEPWERVQVISQNDQSSEVLTPFQDTPCTSVMSVNKCLGSLNISREILTLPREISRESVQNKAPPILEKNDLENLAVHCTDINNRIQEGNCVNSHGKASSDKRPAGNKADKSYENQAPINYPSVVPVHFEGDNNGKCGQVINSDPTNAVSIDPQAAHSNSNSFAVPPFAASMPSIHHVPSFPSCTLFQNNQDAYRYVSNISPAFSDLILSTLQQNPAIHAAARLAASFWPHCDRDISLNSLSESCIGEIPARSVNPCPRLAAAAMATVAAATAWWAIHGLIPFCHPFPAGFSFAPPSMVTNAATESNRTAEEKEAKDDASVQVHDPQLPDAQIHRHSIANLSPQQSSDSDESGKYEGLNAIGEKATAGNELVSTPDADGDDTSNKARAKKKQDRSSCGSNTPSSSDETDIVLENLNKSKEEVKDSQAHLPSGEGNSRRSRSISNVNESWREVSEEGRLAFQALFSREVLPQSFSPPSKDDNAVKFNKKDKGSNTALIDLSCKRAWMNDKFDCVKDSNNLPSQDGFHSDKSVSLNESGQGKLKTRRTGFKPYKRCSTEAKETMVIAGEENGAKRIRLEDETSS